MELRSRKELREHPNQHLVGFRRSHIATASKAQDPSWVSSPNKGSSGQLQPVAKVLWKLPPPPPSREDEVLYKTLSRARTCQQLCCTKYSWHPTWMCLRSKRIKMPGSQPQIAQTPGELVLLTFFQIGGDEGVSHPSFSTYKYIFCPWVLFAFLIFSIKDF